MAKKIRVGILFGGKSVEHEISILSAKNVAQTLDKKKYDVVLIGIDKKGSWHHLPSPHLLLDHQHPMDLRVEKVKGSKKLIPGSPLSSSPMDVIFPILHGPFGEDGTVQGLLKLANIPFVGPSVLGSAICMDKEVTKRLLKEAGISIADFLKVKDFEEPISFSDVVAKLGCPFFIKPANLGSSVGIHKVKTEKEYKNALKDAFQFDTKILIEKYIEGREVECAVLGNENPMASRVGEIIPQHEFYSYEAKYLDENGAVLKAPAELAGDLEKRIQNLSLKVFKLLECEGMARVDFFLTSRQEIIVNEVNTIPGFTKISMYPKLFEASGISYSALIDRLIQLALERFKKEQKLKTSFRSP